MKFIIWFILCLISLSGTSQPIINLDFEPRVNNDQPLALWQTQGSTYQFRIDTTLKRVGKGSLLLESQFADELGFASIYTSKLPATAARGKILTLKVACLAGQSQPVVQTYISVLGSTERLNGVLQTDTLRVNDLWQQIRLQSPVSGAASKVVIGFRLLGPGKVWFDQMEVLLDDVLYQDLPLPPDSNALPTPARVLSPAELAWLSKHSQPLQTVSPGASFTDLAPLKLLWGSAKVVGLGEVSHGSKEIFQMKHRLIRYLVEELDYRVVAMETDMAAAQKLNQYVLEGKGDAKQLLAALGFWTWNTEEVLALIRWMRSHNQKSPRKIKFVGFDMQLPEAAIESLLLFATKHDTVLVSPLNKLKIAIAVLRTINTRNASVTQEMETSLRTAYESIWRRIERQKGDYLRFVTLDEFYWVRQQATLLDQFIQYRLLPLSEAVAYRDACMVDNLHWWVKQYPREKVILWAHNEHVRKNEIPFEPRPLGNYLYKNYGDQYVAVGFAFAQGSYRGIDPQTRKLTILTAQPALIGSYEYFFQAIQKPIFLLDLIRINLSKETQWLFEPFQLRDVGAMPNPEEFSQTQITKNFDAVLFIKQSTAAEGL